MNQRNVMDTHFTSIIFVVVERLLCMDRFTRNFVVTINHTTKTVMFNRDDLQKALNSLSIFNFNQGVKTFF